MQVQRPLDTPHSTAYENEEELWSGVQSVTSKAKVAQQLAESLIAAICEHAPRNRAVQNDGIGATSYYQLVCNGFNSGINIQRKNTLFWETIRTLVSDQFGGFALQMQPV